MYTRGFQLKLKLSKILMLNPPTYVLMQNAFPFILFCVTNVTFIQYDDNIVRLNFS